VPDEQSNLNSPAAGRSPSNRRRGRRGGRGRSRGPRPAPKSGDAPAAEDISPAPETVESTAAPVEAADHGDHGDHAEHEAEASGGFRVPHAEAPAEFASHEAEHVEHHESEATAENIAASEPEPVRPVQPPREQFRERRPDDRRQERRPEPQAPSRGSSPLISVPPKPRPSPRLSSTPRRLPSRSSR